MILTDNGKEFYATHAAMVLLYHLIFLTTMGVLKTKFNFNDYALRVNFAQRYFQID